MALNFPSSPTNGQVYEGYVYDATKGIWTLIPQMLPNTLDNVVDVDIDPAVANNHTLLYNATSGNWESSAIPASAIASGTFDIARIPTGTTSSTVSLGNHTHVANDLPDLDDLNGTLDIASGGTGGTTVAEAKANLQVPLSHNYIINGAFDIWQRGTSFSVPILSSPYTADRFYSFANISGGTVSVSRQALSSTDIPENKYGSRYHARLSVANYSSGAANLVHRIEGAATLAGKTATLSFWGKANNPLTATVNFSRSFDDGVGGGDNIGSSTVSITTSWTKFAVTVSIPQPSTQNLGSNSHLQLIFAISQNADFDIWGVQLEEGPVATPFRRNQENIQAELAACQRYYFRFAGTASFNAYGTGRAGSTTAFFPFIQYPVEMRTSPTSLDFSNLKWFAPGSSSATISALAIDTNTVNKHGVVLSATTTGLTAGQILIFGGDSPSYFGLSAEL